MADSLKIKIDIADRVYPMTIAAHQEEGLRLAAKKINSVIKQFEKSYAVRDKQDVLAMCALQFAAKSEQQDIDSHRQLEELGKRLETLDNRLQSDLESRS